MPIKSKKERFIENVASDFRFKTYGEKSKMRITTDERNATQQCYSNDLQLVTK